MSKSILDNINTGFSLELTLAKPEAPPEKPFISITIPEPKLEQESKYTDIKILLPKPLEPEEKKLEIIEYSKEEYYVPGQEVTQTESNSPNLDSILDEINTGFGPENTLTTPECQSVTYYRHLYKDTYLSEFETDDDKEKARTNLNIYSKLEVLTIVSEYLESRIESLIESLLGDLDLNFTKGLTTYSITYNLPIRLLAQLGTNYIPLTEDRAVIVLSSNIKTNDNSYALDLGTTTLTRILQELLTQIRLNASNILNIQDLTIEKANGVTAETIKINDTPVSVTYNLNWESIYGTTT